MRIVFSARVEADLANQLEYGIERFGVRTAERVFQRVDAFLHSFLPLNPRTGRWIAEARLYEAWIANTPFIVFYRIDPDERTIIVLALFHYAQDRSDFEPDT